MRASPQRDLNLGTALLILGGLLLFWKILGFAVVQFVLRLWPVVLIVIGWQMYRRVRSKNGGANQAS